MDRVLLLSLLCLQVFLLTTAFPSTEKAVNLADDQHQQLPDLGLKDGQMERMKIRVRRGCGWMPGSCNSFKVKPKPIKASVRIKKI